MQYQVKLDVFEGPFDLLLDLITKQKIDVCDLSLTEIVQDYLNYITEGAHIDLEVTSEFLILAATLLKIKSNSLIGPGGTDELEDLSPAEARELLVARLLEYKKFKNASEHLETVIKSQAGFYRRTEISNLPSFCAADLVGDTTISDLAALLIPLLLGTDDGDVLVSTRHILSPPVNLSLKIDFVLNRLRRKGEATFRSLTKECKSRIEIAVTFLALLELRRKRRVVLEQNATFGEITVRLSEPPSAENSHTAETYQDIRQ